MPGLVPEEKIHIYMNACDVVVFPYQNILTSGAVILAMSFGKACVAPIIKCIIETLDQSGVFLYRPQTKDGLAKALQQANLKKSELHIMGEYNLNITKQWNWGYIAEVTTKVYSACLKGKEL